MSAAIEKALCMDVVSICILSDYGKDNKDKKKHLKKFMKIAL